MLALLLAAAALAAPTPARQVAFRDGANLQRPVWSPDGSKLSYEANFHEKKIVELYDGDPKTGAFTKVTPAVRSASSMTAGFSTSSAKGGQVAHELDWAPASIGRFVYSASNDDLDYDLFVGGGGALAAAPGADGGPMWSPDGRWIAFTSARTGQGDLYALDVNQIDQPPKRLTTDGDASEVLGAWSPDGTKLVFVGHSDKGDNLWTVGLDGAAPTRVTDWARSQVRPTFSPDGTKIAFYANKDQEDRFDLWVVDAKGGTPVKLADDVVMNAAGPCFTPDGRWIVNALDDDAKFDPLVAVSVAEAGRKLPLDFGTVGNSDVDVVKTADGKVEIAFVAQGKTGDTTRTFDRLYVADLPAMP